MATYNTPGVYVEEISTLPPSVAQVATAIPAFIGFTEKYPDSGPMFPVEISSMVEYEAQFGGPKQYQFTVEMEARSAGAPAIKRMVEDAEAEQFVLYYAIKLFFDNGGGKCYVVSLEKYDEVIADPTKGDAEAFKSGLDVIKKVDEPTLLLFPDATKLTGTPSPYYQVCMHALSQCGTLMDRFTVMDVLETDPQADEFRQYVSSDYLHYGAAYAPFLATGYTYAYREEEVLVDPPYAKLLDLQEISGGFRIQQSASSALPGPTLVIREDATITPDIDFAFDATNGQLDIILKSATGNKGDEVVAAWGTSTTLSAAQKANFVLEVAQGGQEEISITAAKKIPQGDFLHLPKNYTDGEGISITFSEKTTLDETKSITIETRAGGGDFAITEDLNANAMNLIMGNIPPAGIKGSEIIGRWKEWIKTNSPKGISILPFPTAEKGTVWVNRLASPTPMTQPSELPLTQIKTLQNSLYHFVKDNLKKIVVLPPSSAIAGIYARVDRDRGVWKAPANVAVSAIIGPSRMISHEEQGELNIDPTAGKSINAIRSFRGKGTMVWGARTLAGNDNEWRYVSVRRLFITIEESVQKASAFAVFEPNDATTWLKVKAMIDNYLYGLWQQGALAGPTPESSYFVHIGLGKTMTTQDILEGRMIVEIGIAAVRPAEFIILKFSHKLQEA